jgi:hypothetical protein
VGGVGHTGQGVKKDFGAIGDLCEKGARATAQSPHPSCTGLAVRALSMCLRCQKVLMLTKGSDDAAALT